MQLGITPWKVTAQQIKSYDLKKHSQSRSQSYSFRD
jgi:hypothetical protein